MPTAASPTVSLQALRDLIAGQPVHIVGRVLLPELALAQATTSAHVGVAFGALDASTRTTWLDALEPGAWVLHVVALPPEGVRALFARFTERASDRQPVDEVCTALFTAGIRGLQVRSVEGRPGLLVVMGRKS
jgi:hypothetical protein